MSLRVDPARREAELVVPPGVPLRHAQDFAVQNADWLLARLAALPVRIPFLAGSIVPILGVDHLIRHRPGARGGTWRESGALFVTGEPEHVPRRVLDFLKAEARRRILARVAVHAERLGRRPRRVTLRDTRTRWGSCSARGDLSFSWRLILAPRPVLDYVVAHEVAHLVELNHSQRFWRVVHRLVGEAERPRLWLRRFGHTLHRYG